MTTIATTDVRAEALASDVSDGDAIAFVRDLVATPSVSGQERAACELFVRTAGAWGFASTIDHAGNAIAERESACEPGEACVEIMLLGHIDTVAGDIPVRVEGDLLHGRGSVDAKGPLAAMLVAAARARLPRGVRVVVAGAVGEETSSSPGATALARTRRPHACIVAEPSGWDGVTMGYKGTLRLYAIARRACGHSAGPDASSADAVHGFWSDALAALASLPRASERVFDQVQGSIRAMQTKSDGLHESTTLSASLRLPPGVMPRDVEARLENVARARGVTLCCEGHAPAHVSDRNDVVVQALTSAIREQGATPRPKLKTGTADMNVVAPSWRCPIAAYGPGDSNLDHTPREHLSLTEYLRSIRVVTAALETLGQHLAQGEGGGAS